MDDRVKEKALRFAMQFQEALKEAGYEPELRIYPDSIVIGVETEYCYLHNLVTIKEIGEKYRSTPTGKLGFTVSVGYQAGKKYINTKVFRERKDGTVNPEAFRFAVLQIKRAISHKKTQREHLDAREKAREMLKGALKKHGISSTRRIKESYIDNKDGAVPAIDVVFTTRIENLERVIEFLQEIEVIDA